MTLLTARGVTKRFGGLLAVNSLDFEVEQGAIVSVIGPNGAGKTTFFNCIAGFYEINAGDIEFDGRPIHKLRRDQISHLGISRTYQNIRLFANMTAMENILVGQHHHLRSTWLGAACQFCAEVTWPVSYTHQMTPLRICAATCAIDIRTATLYLRNCSKTRTMPALRSCKSSGSWMMSKSG